MASIVFDSRKREEDEQRRNRERADRERASLLEYANSLNAPSTSQPSVPSMPSVSTPVDQTGTSPVPSRNDVMAMSNMFAQYGGNPLAQQYNDITPVNVEDWADYTGRSTLSQWEKGLASVADSGRIAFNNDVRATAKGMLDNNLYENVNGQMVPVYMPEWTDEQKKALAEQSTDVNAGRNLDGSQMEKSDFVSKLQDWSDANAEIAQGYVDSGKVSGAAKTSADVIATSAAQLPQMAVGAAVNWATGGAVAGASLAYMAASVYGSTFNEGVEHGLNPDLANARAVMVAGVEVATEKMWDIGKLNGGGEFDDTITQTIFNKVADPSAQHIWKLASQTLTEGIEEAISSLADNAIDAVFLNKYEDMTGLEITGSVVADVVTDFFMGAASALLMAAAGGGIKKALTGNDGLTRYCDEVIDYYDNMTEDEKAEAVKFASKQLGISEEEASTRIDQKLQELKAYKGAMNNLDAEVEEANSKNPAVTITTENQEIESEKAIERAEAEQTVAEAEQRMQTENDMLRDFAQQNLAQETQQTEQIAQEQEQAQEQAQDQTQEQAEMPTETAEAEAETEAVNETVDDINDTVDTAPVEQTTEDRLRNLNTEAVQASDAKAIETATQKALDTKKTQVVNTSTGAKYVVNQNGEVKVYDEFTGKKSKGQRLTDRFAKAIGARVFFFDAHGNTDINGFYVGADGSIFISSNLTSNQTPRIFAHELTHHLKQSKLYDTLKSIAFGKDNENIRRMFNERADKARADIEALNETINSALELGLDESDERITSAKAKIESLQYDATWTYDHLVEWAQEDAAKAFGEDVDRNSDQFKSAVEDEMLAKYCEDFLNTKAVVDTVVRENRTLGQKIKDWVSNVIAKLKKADVDVPPLLNEVDRKFADALKDVQDIESGSTEKVSFATDDINQLSTRITADMSDSDRTRIITSKNILAETYDISNDEIIDEYKEELNSQKQKVVSDALVSIKNAFNVPQVLHNDDFALSVTFSNRTLSESLHQNINDATHLAKVLPIISDVVKNAIGIEVHKNRYFYDSRTDYFYNMLGGFVDGEEFIPVRFGAKVSPEGKGTLYVVIDDEGIKKDKVMVRQQPKSQSNTRLSEISISALAENVKSEDIIEYLPDDMLNNEQIEIKHAAQIEMREKTIENNNRKFAKFIENKDMYSANRMLDQAAAYFGYDLDEWHSNPLSNAEYKNSDGSKISFAERFTPEDLNSFSVGDVSDADYDEQINYLNNRDLSMEDYDADETVALDLSHGEMQRLMEIAPEIKGNFNNGFNSMLDITRVLDKVSDGNAEVREFFKKSLELPMREAKDSYVKGMRSQWDAIADLVEKTGIKAGTQESAAAQWYGEGYKQLEDGTRVDYTLDDLKKDFPSKWQDIVKVEQFARQAYDNYVDRINEVLEKIYPDIEKQQKDKIIKAKVKLQDAIKMFTEARLGANQDMVDYYDLKVDQAWAELEYEQNRYTSGDYLLNKRLQKRSDYFRHFTEMKSSTIGSIVNLLKSQGTLIDPALVGTSEFSKPKTKWQSFMQRQGKGSFTADAIGGLAEYVPNAEYSIAFNPVIAHYRTFEKALRDATRATSSANNLIGYLGDYTNELAGKTNSWDRLLIKSMSETEGRKTLNVIAKLNSRMTANAVVGNVATALKQFSNIPNGLSLVKSNSAWAKGMADYFAGILGDKVDRGAYAKDLLSKSVFMNERYSEFSADDFKNFKGFEKVGKGVSDFFGWMLGFGDEQAARMIWYAAYNEAVEKGSQDPVYDADVITRKAVGGRGVGEIPVFWKNKSINLIMPFQIEVNNSWQNLKQMVGNNDAKGLLRLAVGSYITNLVAKQLVGGDILPDILGVLIDTLKKAVKKVKDDDDETTWGDIVTYALRNTLGQVVAMIPGVNWGGTALVGVDSDLGEKLFGDSNPFSYGTGMMGTKSLAQTAGDILENGFSGADLVSPLLQYGLPMGGRQASRMYSAAQDLGWLPSGGWGNTPFGGERHQIPGKYTNSAEPSLKFSLDTDNLSEVAKALLLGTYATDSAQEYLETRKNEASNSLLQKGIYIQDEYGVDARDFFEWYKIANENGGALSQKDVTSASGLTNDQKWYLWEAMMNTGGDNAWKKQNPYSRPKK